MSDTTILDISESSWKSMRPVLDLDAELEGKSIDQLLEIPSFGAYWGPTYGPIVNLELQGRRIGELGLDFGLSSLNQHELDQKVEEIIILGNALRISGTDVANLIPGEKPDFEVEMPSASRRYVEVTSITPPCPDSYPLVQALVQLRIANNPALRQALDGFSIAIPCATLQPLSRRQTQPRPFVQAII